MQNEERRVLIAWIHSRIFFEANKVSKVLGISLHVDKAIVAQAHDEAEHSVNFHRTKPLDTIDLHRLEMAHIMFWVASLKPVTVTEPTTIRNTVKAVVLALDIAGIGHRAIESQVEDSYKAAKNVRSALYAEGALPINEYIALRILSRVYEGNRRRDIEDCKLEHSAIEMQQQLNDFNKILNGPLFTRIALALRYHVFTPRSFATLAESTFAFDGH